MNLPWADNDEQSGHDGQDEGEKGEDDDDDIHEHDEKVQESLCVRTRQS